MLRVWVAYVTQNFRLKVAKVPVNLLCSNDTLMVMITCSSNKKRDLLSLE